MSDHGYLCEICTGMVRATAIASFTEPRPAEFVVCDQHADEAEQHGHATVERI